MLLRILHRTHFFYAGKASESFNEVRLRPITGDAQSCRRFDLQLQPEATPRDYCDFYGNTIHYFEVIQPHHELLIDAVSEVETTNPAARSAVPAVPADQLEGSSEREMLAEFYTGSPYVPLEVELWREAQDALAGGRSDVWSDVCRLGSHLHRTFAYRPHTTGVSTRAPEALRLRMGVCQDFAHVHLGLCRSLGIPARYVSGYFFNDTRHPQEIEASHAWIEAWIPGFGWAAYDPTHDRLADERYVKVAVGRDYSDIRPVSGTYRGAPARELRVEVEVRQIAGARDEAKTHSLGH